jgi:hypothetical protein
LTSVKGRAGAGMGRFLRFSYKNQRIYCVNHIKKMQVALNRTFCLSSATIPARCVHMVCATVEKTEKSMVCSVCRAKTAIAHLFRHSRRLTANAKTGFLISRNSALLGNQFADSGAKRLFPPFRRRIGGRTP